MPELGDSPHVTTAEASRPPVMPTTETASEGSTESQEKSVATRVVGDVLKSEKRRLTDVVTDGTRPADLKPGERQLWLNSVYESKGFSDKHYEEGGVQVQEGLTAKTTTGEEMAVPTLTGQTKTESSEILYTAKIPNPDQPDGEPKTVTFSGAELARVHLAANAEEIGKVFAADDGSESNAQRLVTWHAKGGDGEPPVDEAAVADVDNRRAERDKALDEAKLVKQQEVLTLMEADNIIADRMKVLATQMEEAGKVNINALSNDEQQEHRKKLNDLQFQLGHLQLATMANGPAGIQMKYAALKVMEQQAGEFAGKELKDTAESLKPQADRATAMIKDLAEQAGVSPSKIAEFQKALNEGGDITAAMSDPEFAKIEGLSEAIFGRKLSVEEATKVDEAIENIIAGADLSEDQINKLKLAKGAGLGVLLALALVLGLTGGAMAFIGKGFAGSDMR